MHGLSALVLGLGLFFLGVQLVGEHLRKLSGESFRRVLSLVNERRTLAALVGLGFGALMQSATAVTFVAAGMVRGGLLTSAAAAPVIIWSNVGLTVLAFLVTFDIHPLVAYLVGLAGIFFGLARRPAWRSAAAVLLGVGLILFGLEAMSEGASPLRNAAWFRELLALTVGSPLTAFAVGVLAAAVLQSNTGAAMLVISLSGLGGFTLEQAALLIYGTNLGAIGLRVFLAWNFDAESRRLVRLEDLFCALGGALMVSLYAIEQAGVPLVLRAVRATLGADPKLGLAGLFLCSNALPAALLSPLLAPTQAFLARRIAAPLVDVLAEPRYLSDAALTDPKLGMDLMRRELSRLLGSVQVRAELPRQGPDGEPLREPGFAELGLAIERFGTRLAAQTLDAAQAHALHLLRTELILVRHSEEGVREFNQALAVAFEDPATAEAGRELERGLVELLAATCRAAATRAEREISELREKAKHSGSFVAARVENAKKSTAPIALAALADSFELTAWMLHTLSKVWSETPS